MDGRQGRVPQAWAPRGAAERWRSASSPAATRRPPRHERKRKRKRKRRGAARAPGVPREDDAQARRGARGPAAERAGELGLPAGRPAPARVAEGFAGRPGPAAQGEPRVRTEELFAKEALGPEGGDVKMNKTCPDPVCSFWKVTSAYACLFAVAACVGSWYCWGQRAAKGTRHRVHEAAW